jgi:hypothetical protein
MAQRGRPRKYKTEEAHKAGEVDRDRKRRRNLSPSTKEHLRQLAAVRKERFLERQKAAMTPSTSSRPPATYQYMAPGGHAGIIPRLLYSPGGTAIDTQNPPARLPAIVHTPRGRRVHDPELVRQILASRQEQSRTLTGQVGRLLTILESQNEREEVDRDLQDGLMAHDGAFFAEAQDESVLCWRS